MSDGYGTIALGREGGVVTLRLNRPPLNVMNIEMMDELGRALEGLASDADLKLLVVKAEGKAFSAGVDVADHTADKVGAMMRSFHGIFHAMRRVGAPIVAAVDGAALGGGCELVAGCDIVLASERAKFGQPEIQVGVFPPIAAVLFPELMGRAKALELVLTGDVIKSEEAMRAGLVTRVLPVEGFDAQVDAYVAKLAALSAPVLRLAKRAVYETMGRPFADAVAHAERIYLEDLMSTEDAHEGLAAFLAKRKPEWRGR